MTMHLHLYVYVSIYYSSLPLPLSARRYNFQLFACTHIGVASGPRILQLGLRLRSGLLRLLQLALRGLAVVRRANKLEDALPLWV